MEERIVAIFQVMLRWIRPFAYLVPLEVKEALERGETDTFVEWAVNNLVIKWPDWLWEGIWEVKRKVEVVAESVAVRLCGVALVFLVLGLLKLTPNLVWGIATSVLISMGGISATNSFKNLIQTESGSLVGDFLLDALLHGAFGTKRLIGKEWPKEVLTLQAACEIPEAVGNDVRSDMNVIGGGRDVMDTISTSPKSLPMKTKWRDEITRELAKLIDDRVLSREAAIRVYSSVTGGFEMFLRRLGAPEDLWPLVRGMLIGYFAAVALGLGGVPLNVMTVAHGLLHMLLAKYSEYCTKAEYIVIRLIGVPSLIILAAARAFGQSGWLPVALPLALMLSGYVFYRKQGWSTTLSTAIPLVLGVVVAGFGGISNHSGALLVIAAHIGLAAYFAAQVPMGRLRRQKILQGIGVLTAAVAFAGLSFVTKPPELVERTPEEIVSQVKSLPAQIPAMLGLAPKPEDQLAGGKAAGVVVYVGEFFPTDPTKFRSLKGFTLVLKKDKEVVLKAVEAASQDLNSIGSAYTFGGKALTTGQEYEVTIEKWPDDIPQQARKEVKSQKFVWKGESLTFQMNIGK